ncbi:MAG: HPr family phosphocarrier protein, partial [Opitutia bacterium]
MEESSESKSREFTVQNRMGIHTRPAAQIVRLANRFPEVDVSVSKDDESVNGKSIMGLMMLAAGQG